SGRWTLAMFAVVVVALVAGWFYVRNRIDGDLLDEMLDDNANDVPDVLETSG
ncbi:MAG TPA: L-asparagine permease, partial [Bifidobacterium sp.]|nr:L-asparagine permease [Bifidobacterium sp.]